MNAWFKPLFTLAVTHEYHGGVCPDFEFLLPASAQALARNGRLLIRDRGHVLYCVYEADNSGAALRPLDGAGLRSGLRIGLRLRNPHFSNFTDWPLGPVTALYRNGATVNQLDGPLGVRLVGSTLVHSISKGPRPVTLELVDSTDSVLQTDQVSSHGVEQFSYLPGRLREGGALDVGYYRVKETYPATSGEAHYYVEPELLRAGVFGVVDIRLDAGFYGAPPAFAIAFAARRQKLNYYVVARKYGSTDFAKLAVSDQGFGEDQRAEVKFTRVAAGDFSAADLGPGLIGSADARVTLFRSDTAPARQARARSKIQLKSNSDVLIPHLPAPTADQAQADLIIHVAKP
jgi:hypothetical protein